MADEATSHILLIGSSDADAEALTAVLEPPPNGAFDVERVATVEAALLCLGRGGWDLQLVDLDSHTDGPATVRRLREAAPAVPLVAITAAGDEQYAIAVLAAGAADCVAGGRSDGAAVRRAVRHTLARHRYDSGADERREVAAREREFGGLAALGGPPTLPVTGRSFGALPLFERSPHEFGALAVRYTALLDLALEERTVRMESRLGEELSAFADRIGLLGGGPRDLIDIHKAAITGRLDGQASRRARAYVEEGRLVLLQVMGYLVTFYRNLSWGRGGAGRSTPERGAMPVLPESNREKGPP